MPSSNVLEVQLISCACLAVDRRTWAFEECQCTRLPQASFRSKVNFWISSYSDAVNPIFAAKKSTFKLQTLRSTVLIKITDHEILIRWHEMENLDFSASCKSINVNYKK